MKVREIVELLQEEDQEADFYALPEHAEILQVPRKPFVKCKLPDGTVCLVIVTDYEGPDEFELLEEK